MHAYIPYSQSEGAHTAAKGRSCCQSSERLGYRVIQQVKPTEAQEPFTRAIHQSHPPASVLAIKVSPLRRHPLLHADYLTWKDESMRREQRPRNASGSVRRLPNRKEVMAQNAGTASDVTLSLVCIAEGNRLLMTCHVDLLTTYLSSWKGTCA